MDRTRARTIGLTRRRAAAALAGLWAGLAAGPALAALSSRDRDTIAKADAYLNGITTMKGRFEQLAEQGLARGTFYMSRPGRLRFEYDPPAKIRFIVDGTWVGVDDMDLKVVNRYPLSSTPLKVLLSEGIDLARDTTIASVEELPGHTRITMRKDDGLAQGELTLVFSRPDFELQQWIIVDAQGTRTSVRLTDIEMGLDFPVSLFTLYDYGYEDR
ncbi:MAG: outer membrane lipoprotein carrier protein LolA [Alphaproteobacteria bacterium]|nr:outer membrane lipoprotein carrier protein LolA [Alphaproteobacteria bacterium]